jgi:hypothetical protein
MTSAESHEGAGLRAVASPERPIISSKPLTVEIVPGERLREQIGLLPAAGADARTLRLEVEGVRSEWNPEVGIRVFLNLPQADASTSTDDPHYVTTFTFFEHKGGEHEGGTEQINHVRHEEHGNHEDAPQTFYADLTPTLQELHAAGLYRQGEALQTTLIAVPIATDAESNQRAERTIPFTGVAVALQE